MEKKITIVLDRLRSAHNTGNAFRIAEALNADIIGCGYTPLPPHDKLAKTAMGSENMVTSIHQDNVIDAISYLRANNYKQILAVESGYDGKFAYDQEYEFPLALIFGNEAMGITPEAIPLCDGVISLPMFGEKSSINVGNCIAAVMYAVIYKAKIN